MSCYCYIVECADGTYYTCWAVDPERRVRDRWAEATSATRATADPTVSMTDVNTPANTPSQRVMNENPSGKDDAMEPSLPDSEQVAPETLFRRQEQGGGAPEDQGLTVGERTTAVTNREGSVTAREEAAGLREETSTLREEAVRAREEAAQARSKLEELLAQMREDIPQAVVPAVTTATLESGAAGG